MVTEDLQDLLRAGYSIIPTEGKRAVLKWTYYQEAHASLETAAEWALQHKNFAIICGSISGGMECLDIDLKNDLTGTLYNQLKSLASEADLLDKMVIQKTINNGYHWLYKTIEPIAGTPLASGADGKTTIETRGQGQYFLIEPSEGYSLEFGDYLSIQFITLEQRDLLYSLCRSFDHAKEQPLPQKVSTAAEGTPWEDYNKRGDVIALLKAHGWTVMYVRGEVTYLRRPGKHAKEVSATLNHYGNNMLHVFSTNAAPFKAGRAYKPSAVHAFLECDGNFRESAKKLRALNFGSEETVEIVASSKSDDVYNTLSEAYEFRFNVVDERYYFRLTTETEWRQLTDYHFNSAKVYLDRRKVKIGGDALRAIIESDLTATYDPFKSYVEKLAAYRGGNYIEQLASTVSVNIDKRTWVMWLQKFLCAHIAQILYGRGSHVCLVFKGKQAVGKTTWLNKLCPVDLRNDYLFVGDIVANNKDSLVRVSQNWLINLDELESINRSDIGHLKSLLTQDKVTARKPYARADSVMPRRAAFVGSVNKEVFLTDDTGNRRFLVVETTDIDYQHNIDIDLVYAQAKDYVMNGFPYHFSREETEAVTASNESFRVRSLAEILVAQYVSEGVQRVTTTQLAEALQRATDIKLNINDYFIRQLGAAMHSAGFAKTKLNGERGYQYGVEIHVKKSAF